MRARRSHRRARWVLTEAASLDLDTVASRLVWRFAVGRDLFLEVAKLRAARLLWARIVSEFDPQNPKSSMLRTHSQTSGWSLTEQDPYNNIIRTTIECMSAVLGGTQSLHTNSFDEALALPTEFSARIARNTQLVLQEETGITKVVDPLAGSYYVEKLTNDLASAARELIDEVEEMGGMTRAVESGMLSITAEGTTAARAIFAQHPDPKVRNDDHLAMKLVAPEYWHYTLMKPDYKTGVLVTKTFRFDTNYYYWPPDWVNDTPGHFTGSAMPMRFGSIVTSFPNRSPRRAPLSAQPKKRRANETRPSVPRAARAAPVRVARTL